MMELNYNELQDIREESEKTGRNEVWRKLQRAFGDTDLLDDLWAIRGKMKDHVGIDMPIEWRVVLEAYNAFRQLGWFPIRPLQEVDVIRQMNADDLPFCTYYGEPFGSDPAERKSIRLASPGWTLGGKTMKLPVYVEVTDEET